MGDGGFAAMIGPMADLVTAPGLVMREHVFEVPLVHGGEDERHIEVFAREVADPDGRDRPFLVYLQGGPGVEATRPTAGPRAPGWLDRALQDFRVLLLDQRGTGRSSPVGKLEGLTAEQQAGYLTHFRADSIVRDAEHIRRRLGTRVTTTASAPSVPAWRTRRCCCRVATG
jgi:pimeloyl-ACP methyl ester carboxylesterase